LNFFDFAIQLSIKSWLAAEPVSPSHHPLLTWAATFSAAFKLVLLPFEPSSISSVLLAALDFRHLINQPRLSNTHLLLSLTDYYHEFHRPNVNRA
jgi:hypothetical protein